MDDNKLLHKNPEVVSDILNEVKKKFGEISVVREGKHIFLGVNIEINYNTIQVDMVKNLEEYIEICGKEISTLVISTATKKLFEVREYAEQLIEKKG